MSNNKSPEGGPFRWEDKWEFVRNLESGGQGDTFVVRSRLESTVEGVLKQAKPREGNRVSKKVRARMASETTTLNLLHVGNVKVPKVLDFGNTTSELAEKDDRPWFVMEFIRGQTLDKAIRGKVPLPLEHAVAITLNLAETIREVHKRRVIHRDLKPGNLMLRDFDSADLVLLDCGLSFNENDADLDLTEQEPIRNKFLSLPEGNTPDGDRRDNRSDLTAVAAILFYCLTGQNIGLLHDQNGHPPHRRQGSDVRALLASDPRLSQVELFFNRAFPPEIQNRFQTSEELRDRLAGLTSKPSEVFRNPLKVISHRITGLQQGHRKTQLADYGRRIHQHVSQEMTKWLNQLMQNVNKTGYRLQILPPNSTL